MLFPARGRDGGKPGGAGTFGLSSGNLFKGKQKHTVPAGERLLLELPGGGGYGDPQQREPSRVADDVRLGLVSPDVARHDYGVVVDPAARWTRRRRRRYAATPDRASPHWTARILSALRGIGSARQDVRGVHWEHDVARAARASLVFDAGKLTLEAHKK